MAFIQDSQQSIQIQPTAGLLDSFVYLSQNENGRKLYFRLLGIDEIPTGSTATFSGTKPDGNIYSATGTIDGLTVVVDETMQMTAVAGTWDAKIKIINGGNTLATAKTRIVVDPSTDSGVESDSVLEGLVAECQAYAESARSNAYGSPLTASTASAMTDTTRVYVYTGSETGYTAGHWYYYNGTAWADGGVYNSAAIQTDTTLTIAGMAADAKATGDEINDLKEDLSEDFVWTELGLEYTDGGYIKANDGQVASYSTWHYTDYIDVRTGNESDKIYVTGSVNSVGSIEYNAFYTDSQTFISSFSCTAGEVSIPSNARYVRLSYPKASEFVQTLNIQKKTFHGYVEDIKENTFDDAIYIKAQLEFEAGGVSTSTGQNYDGLEQKNRLRSKICKSSKPIKIFLPKSLESPLTGIWFMVFYWSGSDTTVSRTSTSGWLRLPDAYTYTIPANINFRILMYSEQSTDTITDVKSNIVYKAIEMVCPLPIQNSVAQMNDDMRPFVQSLKTSYPEQAKSTFSASHSPLTFVHFSDIHNKPALWKRMAEYTEENSEYLPFALHTGDYVGDNQTSYTDLYNYYMPSVPFLNCVGNHDTYTDSNHTTATKQSVYDKLFNHTSDWGVTFEDDITYPMTYYKDFSDSNIRLIVFDNYYDIAAQKTWIASKMAEAKTLGYSVVTASHQVTGKPTQKIDCSFQTLIPYDTAGIGSVLNTEFDAVIGTFISGGGKHIVHLCGHEHQDWFYKTANGVLNCAVECATDDTIWTEGARVINTKTMDCFNAVGIDTDLGILKVVRIGANADCHNRAKNILSYDYINGDVIVNE